MLLTLTASDHPTSCPEGKRILGDRPAWAISNEKPLKLTLTSAATTQEPMSLRVIPAVDHRCNQLLTISRHGEQLTSVQIYAATPGAVYTCELAAKHLPAIAEQGLELSVGSDEDPLYIFTGSEEIPDIGPHLLLADDDARP